MGLWLSPLLASWLPCYSAVPLCFLSLLFHGFLEIILAAFLPAFNYISPLAIYFSRLYNIGAVVSAIDPSPSFSSS
jgi:hypothetical protein